MSEMSCRRCRVGDVVTVYTKHQPRQLWRLGQVIDVMPSGVEWMWGL